MKPLPKISVIIPAYNEEEFIEACLDSVLKQDYPKNKLQVLVLDGGSTDRTCELVKKYVKKYPVRLMNNPKKLAEPAKTLGFKHATGDFFFYLDSDAELVSKTWFKQIIKPLLENNEIAGSFTRYLPNQKKQGAFNRYVSYNPLQLWSMLAYLLPNISDVTISRKKGYDILKIDPDKSPPIGICLYRKKFLDKIIKNPDTYNYVDIAIPLELAELGHDKFAYVKGAGLYHSRDNFGHEFKRQKRDVTVTYLPVIGQRKFNYINFNNPYDIAKVIFWVIYVDLIFPSLLVGIYKTIKYKDWAGMYELPTNFLLTNYIIWLFISDKNGKKLLGRILHGYK